MLKSDILKTLHIIGVKIQKFGFNLPLQKLKAMIYPYIVLDRIDGTENYRNNYNSCLN